MKDAGHRSDKRREIALKIATISRQFGGNFQAGESQGLASF